MGGSAAPQHVTAVRRAWLGTVLELGSYCALGAAMWGLMGGYDAGDKTWLAFPQCLAYLVPLMIPLTTYVVIARWTGEKLFRHA